MLKKKTIKFNIPHVSSKSSYYISKVLISKNTAGNGVFTKKCQNFLKRNFDFDNVLLTTSCTDALEMSAILCNIKIGDEVIIPSYTFVSTANAFALRGAKIILADSGDNNPNICLDKIEKLINPKTKCVVVVHYAGFSCDIKKVLDLKKKYKFYLIEDCAHSIDSKYKNIYLGNFGDMSTLSFHETKNIQCGEGGALIINNKKLFNRARIIWQKGTNRSSFLEGKVKKYEWIDIGSSFLPNETTAAFLFSQLGDLKKINIKRIKIWKYYYKSLKSLENRNFLQLPIVDSFATINGHIFYIILKDTKQRRKLSEFLKNKNIVCNTHYTGLDKSPFYRKNYKKLHLKNSNKFSDTLLRLPIYPDLSISNVDKIINSIKQYFNE
jgi:dTDP-4-amino-4,6-dideoxygalactose transaminase